MHFRTELIPSPLSHRFSLQTPLLSAGSCFAEHMGQKLARYRFSVLNNPFGVIFNPISLCENLRQCWQRQLPDAALYLQSGGVWRHFQLHSEVHAPSRPELERLVAQRWENTHSFLQKTEGLLLTLGTAWVYEWRPNNALVANCHKVPNKEFQKRLLSVEEVVRAVSDLRKTLPNSIRMLLTVSPVRHLKDTFEGNTVSKATLRLACHHLVSQHKSIEYFPAYELLLDDLRDYRFYKPDMLHPTDHAVEYVWEKFIQAAITEESYAFIHQFEKLLQQVEHRPFAPKSTEYQRFLEKLLQQLQAITAVNVGDLIAEVKQKLQKD